MTSIETADLSAVMGGCRKGPQPQQQQQDPSQQGGEPQQMQQQQGAPQQGGGFDWRSLLSGLLGMAQQFLQPQQQQQ